MNHAKEGQFYLLLVGAAFLNLFDIFSTLVWCQKYGFHREINPLLRYLFSINPLTAIVFKAATVGLFIILIKYAARFNFQLAYRGTLAVVGIYSALLCWHLLGPLL